MLEFHEVAGIFPLMGETELAELADDIKANGLIEPIVLCNGQILDGRNRYLACQVAGVEPHYEAWTGGDPLAYVVSKNLKRRHLNESQRAVVAAKIANMPLGGAVYRSANLPTDGVIQAQAAEMLGVSERSLRTVKAIEREAPELIPAIERGELTVHHAYGQMKRNQAAKVKAEVALPSGQYRCIVIDPPWPVQKIEREVRPIQQAELDYPTMSLETIGELPIGTLAAADGCHVYLWTTHKFLPVALRCFESWGVRYQCLLTWVKPTGMTPYSWMYDTEHALFGRVGSLALLRNGLRLSFAAPVTRHSEKPDAFYERVIEVSPEPRLEMFARRPRPGFIAWGNQVETVEE